MLILTCYTVFIFYPYAGCGAAWLARLLWEQEAGGSNPSIPTNFDYGPLAQLVEQVTLNRQVGGSMPSRSTIKSTNGKGFKTRRLAIYFYTLPLRPLAPEYLITAFL